MNEGQKTLYWIKQIRAEVETLNYDLNAGGNRELAAWLHVDNGVLETIANQLREMNDAITDELRSNNTAA